MGGFSANHYTLHAYTNSSGGIDFYLLTTDYASIAVRSCMIGGPATTLISNTSSASAPSGVEITPLPITPVFITDQNGNIGIGTATSAYPLQVGASIWNNLGSNFALAVAGDVAIGNAVSGSQSKLSIYEGTGGAAFQLKKHNGYTEFSDSQNTINLNSNVGIGTTSPLDLLHVSGNNPDKAAIDIENTSAIASGARPLTVLLTAGPSGFGIPGWANAGVLESSVAGGLVFDAYGTTTPIVFQTNRVEQMRITPSGALVIGAIDPKSYKFAVAGNAVAESMTVKLQANWSDYVFKKDYSLMPLSQVKSYVDKNQHFPKYHRRQRLKKKELTLGR